jgi:pantoate--beta-alanine ligase
MRELERRNRDTNGSKPVLGDGGIDIVRTATGLRSLLEPSRRAGRTIGLVPTMGALHEGHLSLIRRARAQCEVVVVSLFVNPTQFAPGEDFERYPRDEPRDRSLAAREGADVLFAPSTQEMYPAGEATTVEVPSLAGVLCGAPDRRGPGHFRGVATVVTKLFNMAQPDVAYFGQKDFQQTLVIKRLVRDLSIPVRIEVCPTVREPDGLALSSRNAYLTPAERERALSLSRALGAAGRAIAAGATRAAAVEAAAAELETAGVVPEYVEILGAEDLRDPRWQPGERVVIALAAQIGSTRLIDNALIELPVSVSEFVPQSAVT